MINSVRLCIASGLLLIGSMALATPAHAQDGCVDGIDGKPICSAHVGPPPPPDSMKPAPLPPPGLDNAPSEYQGPAAPAPVYVAPAPYVPAPAAPQPAYKQPAAPAPVQYIPVPVQGQTAITPGQSDVAPAAVEGEAVAAPESVPEAVEATATAPEAPVASADVVAGPIQHSTLKPVQDIEYSGVVVAADQVASDAVESTPVIVGVASVILIGGVALLVLHFGPGVSGIRGIARLVLRR